MMTQGKNLPTIYLARHRETTSGVTGQHTGINDLPLTVNGENNARRLGRRLSEMTFTKIWNSPLQRARRTRKLAGFGSAAETDRDLVEWDYGEFEDLRTSQVH